MSDAVFKRPRLIFQIALLAGAALYGATTHAQMTYVPNPSGVTPEPEGHFIVPAPAVCREGALVTDQTLPDTGFIKTFTQFKAHVKGWLTGACDWYNGGVFYKTEMRAISYMTVDRVSPYDRTTVYSAIGRVQALDTRVAGETSGPGTYSLSTTGTHQFDFQVAAESTSCLIPRFSPVAHRSLNAVSCAPAWIKGANIIRAPAGTLSIYIPPAMWSQLNGPARDAAAAWTGALGGTITVTVVPTPCGSGGNCANVAEVPTLGGCAATTQGTYGPDGVVTSVREIQLPNSPADRNWQNRTADRLKRTMAHEIGHLLGPFDYDSSCTLANSVMSPLNTQYPADEICKKTDNMALLPTNNDILPTRNTYGSGVTRVCGF